MSNRCPIAPAYVYTQLAHARLSGHADKRRELVARLSAQAYTIPSDGRGPTCRLASGLVLQAQPARDDGWCGRAALHHAVICENSAVRERHEDPRGHRLEATFDLGLFARHEVDRAPIEPVAHRRFPMRDCTSLNYLCPAVGLEALAQAAAWYSISGLRVSYEDAQLTLKHLHRSKDYSEGRK
jgi:hypothetical protein